MSVRDKAILRTSLKLSLATLLMVDELLADIAESEPQTVRGIVRKESFLLLRQAIMQATHVIDWALKETSSLEQPTATDPHTVH
jgi:hypothetical protein